MFLKSPERQRFEMIDRSVESWCDFVRWESQPHQIGENNVIALVDAQRDTHMSTSFMCLIFLYIHDWSLARSGEIGFDWLISGLIFARSCPP